MEAQLAQQIAAKADTLIARANRAKAYVAAYVSHAALLRDLLGEGDEGRLRRAEDVYILRAGFESQHEHKRIIARVEGSSGVTYDTRITVYPSRGYQCDCPDSRRRGRKGASPCKHVLRLAQHWVEVEIIPGLHKVEAGLP